MRDHLSNLHAAYEVAKQQCKGGWTTTSATEALRHFAVLSLEFLTQECQQIDLVSRVVGKTFMGFRRRDIETGISRAVNRALFITEPKYVADFWDSWVVGNGNPSDLIRMSYTVALAPCLALELFDRQNRKGPATYFECLIGHIFAKALNTNPEKKIALNVADRQIKMTMDFLFHLPNGVRIHLPVKMSTRERVVQAWAHQRILDGAYGSGAYKGLMVLFCETKLDSRSLEVVEVCVPDQWLVYQLLLSKMERIYYFDVPERYKALTAKFPETIQIKEFGEFLIEKDSILGG